MSDHTPGPWRVHHSAPDRIIVNGSCVYRVRDMTTNEDGQYGRPNPSDVALMAAAPELYEALSNLAYTIQAMSAYIPAQNALIREEYHTRTQAAFRVMRKAEGKSE